MTYTEIGIVVPTYNSVATIDATLTSIVSQDVDFPVHIIVQDGASQDATVEIAKALAKKLVPGSNISVEVSSEADSGVAEALNRGFSKMNAAILGWLGSDDILMPGALASVSSYIQQTGAKWVTGLPTVIDTHGRLVALRGNKSPHRHPTGFARGLLARGFHANGVVGGIQQEGTFWTRDLWDQSGGYIDESLKLAFDFELWCRLARFSEVVQLVTPLAAFRIRPGQLSSNAKLYRSEVGQVRKSLKAQYRETSVPSKWRDLGRPVAHLPQSSTTWQTKRYVIGGKPFSRLTEKLSNAVSRPK